MRKILLQALLLFAATTALAGFPVTGNMSMRVVTPIGVAASRPLEFGTFTAPTSASGTVVVNQTAGISVTGGIILISGGAARTAAKFDVTGDGNLTYTFTLPSSVTLSGPGANMTATLSFDSGTSSRTLSSGAQTVYINGTLTASSTQVSGAYSGTFIVNVNY